VRPQALGTGPFPHLMMAAVLLVTAWAPPVAAQVASERYIPQEFVARLLAQRAGETVRYTPGAAFLECPHESPWHNAVFLALKDRPEVRQRLSGALALARHRCDDPRFDDWMLEQLRRSSDPELDPTEGTGWGSALDSYPTEVLRRPEFEALFWETLRDDRISDFVRGRAAATLFRERFEAEQTRLVIRMATEGIHHPAVAMRGAVLRWQWSDGYLTALAEAIESRPGWAVMWSFINQYPREHESNVSPAVRERFYEALRDTAANPRDDWPEDGVAYLRRLVSRISGPPPGS